MRRRCCFFGLFVICLDGRTMHVLQPDAGLTSLALQSKYAHTHMRYAATAQVRSLVGCKGSSQPGRDRESERGGMSTYTVKGLSRPGHYECTTRMTGLAKASEYRRRPSRGREVETHTHLIIQSSYLDVMKCYEKPFSSHTNQPNRDGKKNQLPSASCPALSSALSGPFFPGPIFHFQQFSL